MNEHIIFGPEPVLFTSEFTGNEHKGFIVSTQVAAKVPFVIKRVFWAFGVPEDLIKGNHAHRLDVKILVAIKGSIHVETETNQVKKFILESPLQALYVPNLCWIKLQYAPGSILLALSSTDFDEQDYIHNYVDFQNLRQNVTN